MFFALRKKHLQLTAVVLVVVVLLISTSTVRSRIALMVPALYIYTLSAGLLGDKSLSKMGEASMAANDPEQYLSHHVDQLYRDKLANDNEQMLQWQVETGMNEHGGVIELPPYYQKTTPNLKKPLIQPFDPRFTLAMYYEAMLKQFQAKGYKSNEKNRRLSDADAELPFHWEDWVDMSILNKYILNPMDLGCLPLDVTKEVEKKVKEDEKKKQEEDRKKKAEEDKKIEEERKKKEAELKKEEERKKAEKAKIDAAIEAERKKWETQNPSKQPESSISDTSESNEQQQKNDAVKSDENKEAVPLNQAHEKRGLLKRYNRKDSKNITEYCIPSAQMPQTGDGENVHDNGNLVHPSFNVFRFGGRLTDPKMKLMGKSYLYSHAPPPESIIFLTSDGMYRVRTAQKKGKLLYNQIPESYFEDVKSNKIDVSKSFKKLQKKFPLNHGHVQNDYLVYLDPEHFRYNPKIYIDQFQKKANRGGITRTEQGYLNSLLYGQELILKNAVPKYFTEANMIFGGGIGDHYDWRFFNGIHYNLYEQTLSLHHMVRVFLSFCRKVGINTWVAHGSLLLWYWDGMAFPWDNDIDVQMPIYDLHKLSLHFNQTLIVEDANDGYGRYFLDCGTFIALRDKGNGNNNIDARFIDVDTGLYIDITGLAVSKEATPDRYKGGLRKEWNKDTPAFETNSELEIYNCRNKHFSLLSELSPLRKTMVEGEVAYVPRKFTEILKTEYSKGLQSKKHLGYVFMPQLRLWIPEDDILFFLQDKQGWATRHSFAQKYSNHNDDDEERFDLAYQLTEDEKKNFKKIKLGIDDKDLTTLFELTPNELLMFLKQDEIFLSYYTTADFTHFHLEEMMRLLNDKLTMNLVKEAPDFSPLKIDPFMFTQHVEGQTYAARVQQYMKMDASRWH